MKLRRVVAYFPLPTKCPDEIVDLEHPEAREALFLDDLW